MSKTIFHPSTKGHVAQFSAKPSHALLLVGSNGVGKTHVAEVMIANVLHSETDMLDRHPYYKVISPEKSSISIDAIRDLQRFLQLKTLGTNPIRRAIIIEHAESLTVEAQNAFLKILEEPPADTVILMTADNQRALLPTILSRVQIIPVQAPDEEITKNHFIEAGKEEAATNRAYFLSGGLPGLMTALLDDDQSHPLLLAVNTAKEILQKPMLERLALVDGLSKQKTEAWHTIKALQYIAQTGLHQAAGSGNEAKLTQWHRILKLTSAAIDDLEHNVNTKLVLSNLMLQIN